MIKAGSVPAVRTGTVYRVPAAWLRKAADGGIPAVEQQAAAGGAA